MTSLLLVVVLVCVLLSALTGAVSYALRDYSRQRLESALTRRGRMHRLEPILEHRDDFTLLASSLRIVTVLLLFGALYQTTGQYEAPEWVRQIVALVVASLLSTLFSVGLGSSLAAYFGEHLITYLDPFLHAVRAACSPLLWAMRAIDRAVYRVSPHAQQDATEQAEQQVEEEILAVVEEGEKEGVVDETDREMIESVIQFRDTTAGQIMTARPDIVALPITATLEQLVSQIETSGHSRLPIHDGDLDHIAGILYARDLITILGDAQLRQSFELRKCLRQVLYIPESKPLKDLLQEFRLRKVHMAIVLDEFGGTAGLITIEDVLEELVGEISDEHEPSAPPALQRLDDATWDIDASTYVDEVNTVVGLALPEDGGYETLAGYISSTLGRIPEAGEEFETSHATSNGVTGSSGVPAVLTRWKVLDAEPTRVKRVRLLLRSEPVGEGVVEGAVSPSVEG